MNETVKTLAFVVAAAAAVALVALTRPSLPVSSSEDFRNQSLYPNFKDPLAVTSLEIIEFDDQHGELKPFQVAQAVVKGKTRWSIPSHDNYPADAKDQVASAAAGLMGLKVLEMVSDNQGDQREYGVVDPDPMALKVGATGVGERVVMKGKDGKVLLALVIGKEVPGRPGLRYVRKVGQSEIFIVEAKTDKLSTKFENWIERNLLGINSFDIKRLWIRDHSVDTLRGAVIQRGEMIVEYNDAGEPKWKLIEDRKFTTTKAKPDEGQWVPVKVPAGEELNTTKLDDLKTALDDLKIVDVSRKPAGLSADLKVAADFTAHREALESLERRGFFVAELDKGQVELFSNDGEIRVIMKDGVEYVLRFGKIAGSGAAKKEDKKEKGKEAEKGPDQKDGGLNRYLFVMAEFDPEIIPKPPLEPLPEAKKAAEKKPADEKKGAPAKAAEKKPEEKKAGEKPAAEKKVDQKAAEAKKLEAEKAAKAERKRIEKENKRKQDEYEQKIADGKKRVAELNGRFADWYYVISEDVYRKIHIGQDELFRKKATEKDKKDEHAGHHHGGMPEESTPPGALEKMNEEGPGGK